MIICVHFPDEQFVRNVKAVQGNQLMPVGARLFWFVRCMLLIDSARAAANSDH